MPCSWAEAWLARRPTESWESGEGGSGEMSTVCGGFEVELNEMMEFERYCTVVTILYNVGGS